MYILSRKNNRFYFVESEACSTPDALIKSIFSPKWYGATWQRITKVEKETWAEFLKTGKVTDPNFNQKVLQSWMRSRQAEIDPHTGGVGRDFLSLTKLESRNEKLIIQAEQVLDTLYQCLRGSGFMIVLIGKNGHILRSMGELESLRRAEKFNFGPGAHWTEEAVGTNGIGTSLAFGQPAQVTGPEHYCECQQPWTCSSAPIRTGSGEIIGFVDISGPRERASEHQLGMVVAAAHAIEDRIVLEESYDQLNDTNQYLEAILNSVSEGIVAVNAKGVVTSLNKKAAKTLRLHPREVIGQSLIASVSSQGESKNFFKTRSAGMIKEEVQVKVPSGKGIFSAKANPVISKGKNNLGYVLTLKPKNRSYFLSDKPSAMKASYRFSDIIGDSDSIRQTIKKAKMVAPGKSTIVLLGESGTGKELFAQAIHSASDCCSGPFIPVNCGAIPKELIQSELFGYVDGAFTGAKRGGSIGKFEAANGGTLFLDEISEMPLEMQINLLRVLEEKAITPVGGKKVIHLNVRIIAATNKSLFEEMSKGLFREDLYYRLNVINIVLPSLKSRKGDIGLLTRYWVDKLSRKAGRDVKKIEPDVLHWLENHHWPGNVRELVNVLESAVNFILGDTFAVRHLPAYIRKKQLEKPHIGQKDIIPLHRLEKENIKKAIQFYDGNITQAAKALGIGRNTLYDKMRKYGIK
ncbi:GAF modulated sigma54 specific transcriptional regulator, Fis family [Desulfotignum phosphitoxidans DSM 13687]|uniref:GAF modulated sigma54 specific transcriptional regulator, Fis family n=2 Tax=Desulfotignum phosphitoxidans TaxID=190898 RepID=S0G854_9BACT|nr:GAF modulated sigma54 specific transcriptional regulator, Fis family [Desulfotignum phosphitoxidans DSM 13687]